VGSAFFALGIGLPGLVVQDSWRYAFFSAGQGAKAFINDSFWTLTLMATLLLGHHTGHSGIEWAMFAFGGSATLAAAFGVLQSGIVPDPTGAWMWLRDQRDLGVRFLLENVVLGAGRQVRSFIVAASSGLAAVGAIRGAEMLIGPIGALLMGVAQVAVPEAAHFLRRGPQQFRRLCLTLSLGLASASLAWGALILIAFPHGIGHLLLGPVWTDAQVLVPASIIGATAGCLQVGPSAGLRALGRADRTLRSQLIVSSLYVLLGGVGAIVGGARGTVWGTAVAATIGAAIWWHQLRRGVRERESATTPEPVVMAAQAGS
jgi:O-antigen/teichoic acid export membrane protein